MCCTGGDADPSGGGTGHSGGSKAPTTSSPRETLVLLCTTLSLLVAHCSIRYLLPVTVGAQWRLPSSTRVVSPRRLTQRLLYSPSILCPLSHAGYPEATIEECRAYAKRMFPHLVLIKSAGDGDCFPSSVGPQIE